MSTWMQEEAIEVCRKLEHIAPAFGGHVALTGGALYKDGARKDIDILIYRIRQSPKFDWNGFFKEIEKRLGILFVIDFGWNKKAEWNGRKIDFFDPDFVRPIDSEGDDYP